jgi:hypothetical protein
MFPLGALRAREPAIAPGLTSMLWFCRVSSIAAEVRLSVTTMVKDPPAATVAGTPEHWKTSRLVEHPFSVRAFAPAVHLTLIFFVAPATTVPKPTGLGVHVIAGVVDGPIPKIWFVSVVYTLALPNEGRWYFCRRPVEPMEIGDKTFPFGTAL